MKTIKAFIWMMGSIVFFSITAIGWVLGFLFRMQQCGFQIGMEHHDEFVNYMSDKGDEFG